MPQGGNQIGGYPCTTVITGTMSSVEQLSHSVPSQLCPLNITAKTPHYLHIMEITRLPQNANYSHYLVYANAQMVNC